MQKFYKKATLILAAAMSMTMYACKDDNGSSDDLIDPAKPINPVAPSAKEAMSAEDQKENLEKVAIELAEKMPASDFENLIEYLMGLSQHLGQYNDGELTQWSKQAVKSMTTLLNARVKNEKKSNERAEYVFNYTWTASKKVMALSAFTGHFSVKDNKWVYEKASDLQFNFKDQDDNDCTITLKTSGQTKTVHLIDEIDGYDSYVSYTYNNEVVNTFYSYEDTTKLYMELPEKVQISFAREGVKLANLNCDYKLSDLEGEEFDMHKSSMSNTATLELANGYKYEVVNFSYKPEKNATLALRLSKDKKSLISFGLTTDVKFPTVFFSDLEKEPETYEEETQAAYWAEEAEIKNFNLKLDILGKVQVQGTIADFIQFDNVISEISDLFVNDEEGYKKTANDLNALLDCGIFYDGKNAKQADIKIEAFGQENGESEYWSLAPVIKFADGTSYSDLDSFFSKKNFSKALEAFEGLVAGYLSLASGESEEE